MNHTKTGWDKAYTATPVPTDDIVTVKERYDACPDRPKMQIKRGCVVTQLWGVELVLQPDGHWYISDTCD